MIMESKGAALTLSSALQVREKYPKNTYSQANEGIIQEAAAREGP